MNMTKYELATMVTEAAEEVSVLIRNWLFETASISMKSCEVSGPFSGSVTDGNGRTEVIYLKIEPTATTVKLTVGSHTGKLIPDVHWEEFEMNHPDARYLTDLLAKWLLLRNHLG